MQLPQRGDDPDGLGAALLGGLWGGGPGGVEETVEERRGRPWAVRVSTRSIFLTKRAKKRNQSLGC